MYRLNCKLSDELGDRLHAYSEKACIPKVSVVSLALNAFLSQEETKSKLLEQLSDPIRLGEVCKALGLEPPRQF